MAEDRNTWLPFSRDEVKEIRASMVADPLGVPPCPQCTKPLQVQGPRRKAFDIRCNDCRRNTIIPEELLDSPI